MTALNFSSMRQSMVESQLRTNAVSEPRIVSVMGQTPREAYLPEHCASQAYIDSQVPLGQGRSLNPPLATGRLLVEAQLQPSDHVLLIGAATGYTATLLAALCQSVVAVEYDKNLLEIGRPQLANLTNMKLVEGPLVAGHAADGPYDVLLIDGAVPNVPQALVDQVKDGGRVVTGIVDSGVTRLCRGAHFGSGLSLIAFIDLDCTILPGFEAPKKFTF